VTQKDFDQFKALMTKAFVMTGSKQLDEQKRGQALLAKAFEVPLRKGVFAGDIVTSIFTSYSYPENYGQRAIEYPLDFIVPGTEKEYVAYVMPNEGDLPTAHAEGDYVMVPVYEVAFAVSWLARLARDGRFDEFGRRMQAMEAAFVKKRNTDGWRVLIASAADRNLMIYDSQAAVGSLTKRLISNMKVVFKRNGGGNASSVDTRELTDLWCSPELVEDIRNWGLDQVDDITRREIYTATDGGPTLSRVFGVNLHPTVEFGEGQEFQTFFSSIAGAALASGDVELLIGINGASSHFVHPVVQEPSIMADQRLLDFRKAGLWGWASWGFGSLENRDICAGSA
jgi:hypothetical protein